MTDVVTLDERKSMEKCELRMLLSAIPKKMTLSGKERWKIVKIYYLNGQNTAHTLRVYRRNYGLWRGPCTEKAVIKFELINLKKLVAHAIDLCIDDLPFLLKLLQKFIRR